jgi:hypothetical protein
LASSARAEGLVFATVIGLRSIGACSAGLVPIASADRRRQVRRRWNERVFSRGKICFGFPGKALSKSFVVRVSVAYEC